MLRNIEHERNEKLARVEADRIAIALSDWRKILNDRLDDQEYADMADYHDWQSAETETDIRFACPCQPCEDIRAYGRRVGRGLIWQAIMARR